MRFAVVLALLLLAWPWTSLYAQNAHANLTRLEAADVTDEVGKQFRDVCLDGGAYILVFRLVPSPEDDIGWGFCLAPCAATRSSHPRRTRKIE